MDRSCRRRRWRAFNAMEQRPRADRGRRDSRRISGGRVPCGRVVPARQAGAAPAYTEALWRGPSPWDGTRLAEPYVTAMHGIKWPRQISLRLIAYMKSMGSEPVPGVSETAVRIGIVLPDDANSRVQRDEILAHGLGSDPAAQ